MTRSALGRRAASLGILAGGVACLETGVRQFTGGGALIGTADAVVGRPGTPVSAAGTARRTTRRVVRRTTMYVATLPAGCARVSISGQALWQCGATYYAAEGTKYVVVVLE